jgi:restriction system protein
MAKRRYSYYKKEDPIANLLAAFSTILIIGLFVWGYTHPAQLEFYSAIAVAIVIAGIVVYFVIRRKRAQKALGAFGDEELLFMLKGMSPSQFEKKVADIFTALGYETNVTGGANDGGVDVIARKDGKKFYIQCKKFITREVTPHDVRDFLGAITNVNGPAEKGFFITTNGFTLMAEKAAEGNPRIELIDGNRLVEYYRLAQGVLEPMGSSVPTPAISIPQSATSKVCPQCGGRLEIKIAQQGPSAGSKFWGCSNFPTCRYTESVIQ